MIQKKSTYLYNIVFKILFDEGKIQICLTLMDFDVVDIL